MDDKFIDPSLIPSPDLFKTQFTMNTYDGAKPDEITQSPQGDTQQDPNCNRPIRTNSSVTNVLNKKLNSTVSPPNPLDFLPAEAGLYSETGAWSPTGDGTAMEEDLMNGVRSTYSSLIPKGDGVAVYRPDALVPAPPPPKAAEDASDFIPKEIGERSTPSTPVQSVLIPELAPYTTADMEHGIPTNGQTYGDDTQSFGPDVFTTVDQQSAMINSQFQSVKMDTPRIENVLAVSRDNGGDVTGLEQPEGQIPGKKDSGIIEGTAAKDVSLTVAQEVIGATKGVIVPGLQSTNNHV